MEIMVDMMQSTATASPWRSLNASSAFCAAADAPPPPPTRRRRRRTPKKSRVFFRIPIPNTTTNQREREGERGREGEIQRKGRIQKKEGGDT